MLIIKKTGKDKGQDERELSREAALLAWTTPPLRASHYAFTTMRVTKKRADV